MDVTSFAKLSVLVDSWCLLYISSKHSVKTVIDLVSFWRFLGLVAKHSKHKAFSLLDAWQPKLVSRMSSEFFLNQLIYLLVFFPKPLLLLTLFLDSSTVI